MLIAVTGMKREAKLIARDGLDVIVAGGSAGTLKECIASRVKEARGIVSIGIAGGLAPDLHAGAVVLATEVTNGTERIPTDAAWLAAMQARLAQAHAGALAGSDQALASLEAKAALHRETGALAVDMESHRVARAARDWGLPFMALRVIGDDAAFALPPAALVALKPQGGIATGALIGSLIRSPQQIPALLRTARDANIAFAGLLRCLDLLGPALACPYLGELDLDVA